MELMTENVVSEVHAVIYVALSKEEKHMLYGELFGTEYAYRNSRGVTQTEVVMTAFNRIIVLHPIEY